MKSSCVHFAAAVGFLAHPLVWLTAPVHAGVSYQDPAGGWRYRYNGNFAPGSAPYLIDGFGNGETGALDGTWRHDQGDKWDGSGISDGIGPTPNGPSPGGAEVRTEEATTYVRLQDTGNPETHGWLQGELKSDDSNRRLNFAHRMTDDGALASKLVLSDGITVSFRARIPNSGPLDNIYMPDGTTVLPWFPSPPADYNSNSIVDAADYVLWRKHLGTSFQLENEVEGVTPAMVTPEDYDEWRNRFGTSQMLGRGYPMHDNARGMFYVVQQNDALGVDGAIAFSLMTSVDAEGYCAAPGGANADLCANPRGGLVMNNLNGNSAAVDLDTFDPGTLNLLEIPDDQLDDWHEFWITIQTNGAAPGTHAVNVYLDGSTTPTAFNVTVSANDQAAYLNDAWLAMGLSSSDLFGSVDVDFYSYALGVLTPVAAGSGAGVAIPEPASTALALVGLFAIVGGARRRHD